MMMMMMMRANLTQRNKGRVDPKLSREQRKREQQKCLQCEMSGAYGMGVKDIKQDIFLGVN